MLKNEYINLSNKSKNFIRGDRIVINSLLVYRQLKKIYVFYSITLIFV